MSRNTPLKLCNVTDGKCVPYAINKMSLETCNVYIKFSLWLLDNLGFVSQRFFFFSPFVHCCCQLDSISSWLVFVVEGKKIKQRAKVEKGNQRAEEVKNEDVSIGWGVGQSIRPIGKVSSKMQRDCGLSVSVWSLSQTLLLCRTLRSSVRPLPSPRSGS